MFRNQALLSHSKTSAFVDYGDLITDNGNSRRQLNLNLNMKRNSIRTEKCQTTHTTKSSGVSFNTMTNVIGYDGGRENLFNDDEDDNYGDDDDDDVFSKDSDDVITGRLLDRMDELLKLEMAGSNDLDQLTAINTQYNANPVNFKELKSILVTDCSGHEKSPPSRSLVTLPQPDVIPDNNSNSLSTATTVFKCSLVPTYTVTDDVIKNRSSVKDSDLTNGQRHHPHTLTNVKPLMTTSSNQSLSFGRQLSKDNDLTNGQRQLALMTTTTNLLNDQSPSPGRQLSEDSSTFSCTNSSDSSGGSRSSPPDGLAPPPPLPPLKTVVRPPVVPARKPRPRDHNSADPRLYTSKRGGKLDKAVEERLKHLAVDLETQRRSPKRPAPPPPIPPVNDRVRRGGGGAAADCPAKPLTIGQRMVKPCSISGQTLAESASTPTLRRSDDETLNSRGRFASIRKLLKIDQQKQQQNINNNNNNNNNNTNGNTNLPDKKFRSLRRFPSPFTKNRIDLAEMRNLFHTERDKCSAAGEIATDSAVVVTDIVELRSAANTLTRHSSNKEECFSSPSYVNDDSYSNGYGNGGFGQNFHSMQNVRATPPSPVKTLLNKADSQPTLRCYDDKDDDDRNNHSNDQQGYQEGGKHVQELYDKMTSQDVATLADVADRFPDLGTVWKRSMAHIVNATDLKFNNFLVLSNVPLILTETMAIYPGAVKLEQEFLEMPMPKVNILMTPIKYSNGVSAGKSKQRHVFNLPVITEFQDYVPGNLLKISSNNSSLKTNIAPNGACPLNINGNNENVLCKITVLPNVQFLTLDQLRENVVLDDQKICFIMIQLITCLKYLQSQGVEEVRSDMDGFLLMHSSYMRMPKLCLCWEAVTMDTTSRCQTTTPSLLLGNQRRLSLCHCALRALYTMMNIELSLAELLFRNKFPPKFFKKSLYSDSFQLVVDELIRAKSQSLTQAKSFLEYTFWVVNNSLTPKANCLKFNQELDAKIWLESERAKQISNLLKLMLKYPDQVDTVEECRIQFLLNSTPKYLLDASKYANFERYDIIV